MLGHCHGDEAVLLPLLGYRFPEAIAESDMIDSVSDLVNDDSLINQCE